MVIMANMAATAKTGEDTPLSIATPVERAVTAAEWELGIPPVDVMRDQLSSRVAMNWMGTLTNWANKIEINEAQRGKL
jgi:hypothetical protein